MSLYEKYRPQSLEEFVGNKYIVDGLKNHFKNNNHNHSFLFYGPSGCGKSTLGMIVAGMVGSKKPDFVRINGADFRGIDMARQINEEVGVRPLVSKCRMYMIEETQMLTKPAQNALLDVLEHTPDYVYFVLTSTNPEMIIKTIQNRCTRYRVNSLRRNETVKLLLTVVEHEGIKLLEEVLEYIALVAEDVPRTALNYLEQVSSVNDPEKALDLIEKLVQDEAGFGDLIKYTISGKKDWKRAFKVYCELEMEAEQVRRGLLTYCKNKLLKCTDDKNALFYVKCIDTLCPQQIAMQEPQLVSALFELVFVN